MAKKILTDFMDELPSDVVRNIYVKYCGLRNADDMRRAAQKVAVTVSDYLVHALNTKGQYTYYPPTLCHLINFSGHVRIYGTGRIVTLHFCDRQLTVILKIKPRDGVYIITECEYDTCDMFAILAMSLLVEHFNGRVVIANARRPTKSWIKFHLRDKLISDLSVETQISVYRLEKILDSY
jgi:hypothetical protein